MKSGDQTPKRSALIRRGNVSPDPVLTAMGVSAVSQASGVPADSLLALLGTILTGLAGPDASIQDSWGTCRLAKLDLLTATEDYRLKGSIDRFMFPLETIQRRLVENMARHSPDALELIAKGAFSSPTTIKLADQEMRDKSLRRHMETFTVATPTGVSNTLLQDLTDDPVPTRMEAMLHPQFLVKGTDGRSLNSLVENCHLRSALVIHPKLELARKGPDPSKVMKILTSLLDGATVTKRPASIERGRDSSLLARAHALLALTRPEIEVTHAMDSTHLDRLLWLQAGEGQNDEPVDVEACDAFSDAYEGAIEEILDFRRKGRGLMMEFCTRGMALKFDSEMRAYEREVEQKAATAGPWARGLPQTLFWALGFLRRSMPANRRPDDESLMATSFAAARRLVESHRGQVLVITNASLLKDRRKLAGRIVEKVTKANSPQTFRELSRYSRDQRKVIVAPVVDALIEVGVLVRDEAGIHTLGPVDLTDIEEILNQKLAQS